VGDYPEALRRALEHAGYDDLRAEQAARRAAGGAVQMGIGLSSYVEITAGGPSSEYGSIELLDDGGSGSPPGQRPSVRATRRCGR
jgi:carbon-monoxide dehydrogenase large subunit